VPNLGDYLGQLLSELAIARMQADLESLRIAEIYASHPLLRSMPVPHMRLPSVDLQVPLVVLASEDPREDESPRGGYSLQQLRARFEEVLDAQLASDGIALSAAHRRQLNAALDQTIEEQVNSPESSPDVYRIADALTGTALTTIVELRPERDRPLFLPEFGQRMKGAVRRAFLRERTTPPRLSVLVTTAEIREAGGSEVLTHLSLRVTEEGLEWTTIQSESGEYDRLVPE
jgi:hypothetical protein